MPSLDAARPRRRIYDESGSHKPEQIACTTAPSVRQGHQRGGQVRLKCADIEGNLCLLDYA